MPRNPMIEVQLPDVTCGCRLEERQAEANASARLYNHEPEKLWHGASCAVVARMELRKVLEEIEADAAVLTLPDPVLESLNAIRRDALEARRDGLLARLDPGRKFALPSRTVTGYDQATGQARSEPTKGFT